MDETITTNQTIEPEQEQKPDLSGVEIVSNGENVSLDKEDTNTKEVEDAAQENNEKTNTTPTEQVELEQAKTEMDNAKNELSNKGIDYDKLEQEYNDNGELSKESYELLEKAGYPKSIVDAVITGWQAKADAFVNKVIETAGGKREYQRVQKFVSEQGKAAIDAFNEIVDKSDLNIVSSYIAGIKAQMVAKYGTNNPTLAGGNNAVGVSGYASPDEMVQAMSDPKYGKDAKYTKLVEDKVAKSTFF